MRLEIIALLTALVLLPQAFAQSLSYSVVIGYDNGALSLKDILLIKASPMPASKTEEYTARIISFKEDILFETAFNVNLEPFYSIPLSKETAKAPQKLTKTTFDLLLPYYANAKSLRILKNDNMLLEVDLSKFSTCNENKICDGSESPEACPGDCTCGNNVCDADENYFACFLDCASGEKDNYCDRVFDQICDPDCSAKDDYDCKGKKAGSSAVVYFIIGLLVVIAALFFWKKRNKK